MSTIQSSSFVSSSVITKETPSLVGKAAVAVLEVDEKSALVKESQTEAWLNVISHTLGKTSAELDEQYRKEVIKYRHEPRIMSERALEVVDEHLKVIQKFVNLIKPELAQSGWDFTLKDGNLEVQGGNLSDKDRQWLENVLNLDETLVSAVKDFYGTVEKFYEHNSEREYGGFAKGNDLIFYHDVAKQINGTLKMKDVMKTQMDEIVAAWEAKPPSERWGSKPYTTRPYADAIISAERYLKG